MDFASPYGGVKKLTIEEASEDTERSEKVYKFFLKKPRFLAEEEKQ